MKYLGWMFSFYFASFLFPIMPILLLASAWYVFFQKQKEEEKKRKGALECIPGAFITTNGGLCGILVLVRPKTFVIRLYDGALAEVAKESVQTAVLEPS